MAVEWKTNGDVVLSSLRKKDTPGIDSTYIDGTFGVGKNGISERAWLCFESGHLNVETLRMTETKVKANNIDKT